MMPPPPRATLFPYTTLFRSLPASCPRASPARGLKHFGISYRSEEHTSELQSHHELVCRLLLEKKKKLRRRRGAAMRRDGVGPSRIFRSVDARGEARAVFFFSDTATTEIYTLSLHDALPISLGDRAPAPLLDLGRLGERGLEPIP